MTLAYLSTIVSPGLPLVSKVASSPFSRRMKPRALLVTLASSLLGVSSVTASRSSSTIYSSSKPTNGYDAVLCGMDGYVDGPAFSCEIPPKVVIWSFLDLDQTAHPLVVSSDAWNAGDKGFQCLSVSLEYLSGPKLRTQVAHVLHSDFQASLARRGSQRTSDRHAYPYGCI